VYGDSAIIRDARENRDTIYADHIGMAKFSSRDDTQYRKVLNAIEVLLEKLTEDELAVSKHSM
jgi:protein SERAC1